MYKTLKILLLNLIQKNNFNNIFYELSTKNIIYLFFVFYFSEAVW